VSSFDDLLAVGDLRSDGLSNEVVRIVLSRPERLPDLVESLASNNPATRGHAADALEKIARKLPHAFLELLPSISRRATTDEVPMVRWHLAMLLSHVSSFPQASCTATSTLLKLIQDPSPFVRSWAITGLALSARRRPGSARRAIRAISPLTRDESPSVAKRASTALRALTDSQGRIPKSWLKTEESEAG
jgi:HEAT repeat protein